MKLARPSTEFPGMYEHYEIVLADVSKFDTYASAHLVLLQPHSDGTISQTKFMYTIRDDMSDARIIDPAWNESSTPPKPANFELTNATTWGDLIYDDIPLIRNPAMQYYTQFLALYNAESLDSAILKTLSAMGSLPQIGTGAMDWRLI